MLFKKITYTNRRLHIHVGLFLVLFIWLFSISGLILNHGNWKFTSFWDEREQNKTETTIHIPAGMDSAALVKNLLLQLKISGEVNNVKITSDSIDCTVYYPGYVNNIHVDFKKSICVQKELSYNAWGKLRNLHTFNGADRDGLNPQPNWIITRIWRFSMDAVAIGLIYLSVSSWIMWFKIRKDYAWGYAALLTGFAVAIYFICLLRI